MSVVSQFFTSTTTQKKQNRRIFLGQTSGPSSVSWPVPPGVNEVEVHVWGGGGNSPEAFFPDGVTSAASITGAGGGGGGYVTHTYTVSNTDVLSITIGGPAGTSSVTVPTQSPGSPISATGGSPGSNLLTTTSFGIGTCFGGSGGSGAFSIAPGVSTSRTFAASGGAGGNSVAPWPGSISQNYWGLPGFIPITGGGGGAGFIYGPGGNGWGGSQGPNVGGGGGGGIKGSAKFAAGGGFLPAPALIKNNAIYQEGGAGISGNSTVITAIANPSTGQGYAAVQLEQDNNWFYLTDVKAIGSSTISLNPQSQINSFPAIAGGGASGRIFAGSGGSHTSLTDAGLWGGGGGGLHYNGQAIYTPIDNASKAGYGGGAGAGYYVSPGGNVNYGGAGIVIIYW